MEEREQSLTPSPPLQPLQQSQFQPSRPPSPPFSQSTHSPSSEIHPSSPLSLRPPSTPCIDPSTSLYVNGSCSDPASPSPPSGTPTSPPPHSSPSQVHPSSTPSLTPSSLPCLLPSNVHEPSSDPTSPSYSSAPGSRPAAAPAITERVNGAPRKSHSYLKNYMIVFGLSFEVGVGLLSVTYQQQEGSLVPTSIFNSNPKHFYALVIFNALALTFSATGIILHGTYQNIDQYLPTFAYGPLLIVFGILTSTLLSDYLKYISYLLIVFVFLVLLYTTFYGAEKQHKE